MRLPAAPTFATPCRRARHFDVPVVFAKKAKSKNIDGDVYTSTVHSYTYGKDYNITLAQKFLGPNDRVLILDDFLANGKAMRGLLDVCQQAGASVAGIGICIAPSRAAPSCAARVTNWPAWPLWTKWAITAA